MRILFLGHRRTDTQIGGLAEFLHYLPMNLKELDIESIVYTQTDDDGLQLEGPVTLRNGIDSYSGPFAKPSFWVSRKYINALIELCKNKRIDIIHAQGLYRCGFMALQIYKQLKIPYIITSHSDISPTCSDRIKRPSVLKRCRKILKYALGLTHLTPHMERNSHHIYDTTSKSTTIANGVDVTKLRQLSESAAEQPYLLSIGRLVPEKGFDILIRAYAELVKQGYSDTLVLAGSGPEETNLKQLALDLHLKISTELPIQNNPATVVFPGYLRDDVKNNLLVNSKMILFATQPSLFEEAFGIVAIEAMAAGKPLVASNVPAMTYLQSKGLQASLVQADDPIAWSQAIKDLLEDNTSRELFGKTNLHHAEYFDWYNIAKQYAQFYKECLTK